MDLSLIHWYLQAFIIFLKVENIGQTLSHQFAIPQKYYCVFSKPPYKSMVWFLYDRNLHHERVKESQGDKKKFRDSFSNIFTQGTRESILFYSLGSFIQYVRKFFKRTNISYPLDFPHSLYFKHNFCQCGPWKYNAD